MLTRFGGLSRRIYFAFLLAAVIPTALAGVIGVYFSLKLMKEETLHNLDQEVNLRARGVQRFLAQLASELSYLAGDRPLGAYVQADAQGQDAAREAARQRLEQDYRAFARLYPHIYQLRFLDRQGREVVRVDRVGSDVKVVPRDRLQDKSDRYYFREGMAQAPGAFYVSPLDLNVEFGRVEQPERPVIRIATPVAREGGPPEGLLIINLHADILLEQMQQLVARRVGTAFLFDDAGQYVFRVASQGERKFSMQPVKNLVPLFGQPVLDRLLAGQGRSESAGGWIIAGAPVSLSPAMPGGGEARRWVLAMVYPESELFHAVFNLYALYAVLLASLGATAVGGYILSKRLLGPLDDLSREAEAVASGDFTRRVAIGGRDEIAALGDRFNRMAGRLQEMYSKLAGQRDFLEQEVRQRTRELEHERAFLETLVQQIGDGILAVGDDGRLRLANPPARRLLGLDPEDVGKPIARLCPVWDRLQPELAAMGDEMRRDVEVGGRTLSISVTRLGDGYVVVARDVSRERRLADERRELDRQMFQMEKLISFGELAVGLAHEVGNPLAGMKAVAQSLQYEEDLAPRVRDALERFEGEVDRLTGFLRGFQGFAAQPALSPETCAVSRMVVDVLFWIRKEAKEQGVRIDMEGLGEAPPIWADPQLFKQLLLNLFMNALHAMARGGTLSIRAQVVDEHRMRIVIADTGSGIPAETLPHVFDPFFTTRADGSGLGLSIVRKIVTSHDAGIEVSSQEGQGSVFTLLWPRPKEETHA